MTQAVYRTVADRKAGEAQRRNRAVETLAARLAPFAREKRGRYLLYGSLARGEARYDSDVDLLLDFPPEWEGEAWRLAESACAELGIAHDIKPLAWCSKGFASRVFPHARIIA